MPSMATNVANEAESTHGPEQTRDEYIGCSVGIMAYNEEANIERTIRAVLAQQGPSMRVEEVIVVASGCTDRTVPIVAKVALEEPKVHLCVQEKREGKASAINLFLKEATSLVVVLIGADVIPETGAIESLCAPFKDASIGMVGGRPVPVNDPNTFMGHAVHLLWRLHDRLARITPKLGEVIAFRKVILGIPPNSAVDEISIQAMISQLGYKLVYEPECIVYNKGPLTVRDFLKQRRRIYAGHLKVLTQQKYKASTMKVSPIARQLIASRHFTMSNPRQAVWTLFTIFLEALARVQGYYDFWRKREDKEATEAARKLLPYLRSKIRKEDMLSVNGPGIMTAVIRAEQHGAELVAKRIKNAVEASTVRVGVRNREVKVTVAYSPLTFASKASNGDVKVSQSTMNEAVAQALAGDEE